MKLLLGLCSIFFSVSAFAANQPIYRVDFEILGEGKQVLRSSTVTVAEGHEGLITNSTDDGTGLRAKAVVTSPSPGKIRLNYQLVENSKKGSLEISKSGVELSAEDLTEENDLKSSSGLGVSYRIRVSRAK